MIRDFGLVEIFALGGMFGCDWYFSAEEKIAFMEDVAVLGCGIIQWIRSAFGKIYYCHQYFASEEIF